MSDEDLLRAIALSPSPIATVKDIQEDIDMSRAGINNRLRQLEENNLVNSRTVGASAKVYWLTDDGRREVSSR